MIRAALIIASIHLILLAILNRALGLNNLLVQGLSLLVLAIELWLPFLYLEHKGEKPQNYGLFIPPWNKLKPQLKHLLKISLLTLLPYFCICYAMGFCSYTNIALASWLISIPIQLLAVAVPEEVFYRGFLQNIFLKLRSYPLGAILLVNIIFALGHFVGSFNPYRLLTFFPGLIFSYLSYRNGNITTAVLFHALCNLISMMFI